MGTTILLVAITGAWTLRVDGESIHYFPCCGRLDNPRGWNKISHDALSLSLSRFVLHCRALLLEADVMTGTSSSTGGERVELAFEGVELELTAKNKKSATRRILDGSIRGKAVPGRLLAIMGPSGSGKTTLLDALAGKIKHNPKLRLRGRRYLNQEAVAGDSVLPAAYIEQESNFFPHMTVQETLEFRVQLKMGRLLTKSQRDQMVQDLMTELGLSQSAHTIVGDKKIRGVSGGERKRLSIACEMISSPSILFLDEPTSGACVCQGTKETAHSLFYGCDATSMVHSRTFCCCCCCCIGLDSYQALQVVETLRKLADSGKTVIAVIHQPSQQAFSMFDDLLLLSEGRQMYFGPVASVRAYTEKLGYPPSAETGTAEHVLDCISRIRGDQQVEQESADRLDRMAQHAKEAAVAMPSPQATVSSSSSKYGLAPKQRGPRANIFKQFQLLLTRSLNETVRGKAAIIIKIVQQVSLGLIYGGIYHLGNNQASIQDRVGLLSLVAIGAANMGMAGTIRSFPREKSIVSGEISSKLYKTLPYFLAKAISEIPLIGVFNTIFGTIVYHLTGLQKGKFRTFLGIVSLHSIASEAAGLLIGACSPSSDVALAIFPAVIILNIIFDGKNISEENTPRVLRWIPRLGLIRWGFEGMVINEFQGLEFDTSGPRRGPVAKNGYEALDRFGFAEKNIGDVFRAQLAIIGVSWFLSYLGLSATQQKFVSMELPDNENDVSR